MRSKVQRMTLIDNIHQKIDKAVRQLQNDAGGSSFHREDLGAVFRRMFSEDAMSKDADDGDSFQGYLNGMLAVNSERADSLISRGENGAYWYNGPIDVLLVDDKPTVFAPKTLADLYEIGLAEVVRFCAVGGQLDLVLTRSPITSKAVYVFCEDDVIRYVGKSNNLKKRLDAYRRAASAAETSNTNERVGAKLFKVAKSGTSTTVLAYQPSDEDLRVQWLKLDIVDGMEVPLIQAVDQATLWNIHRNS